MDISGGGRSPFSPRIRTVGRRNLPLSAAKNSLSGKLGAVPRGDVILRTQSSSVESYGLPLPVLVTETLTFANVKDVSARLSPNGWSWLVCARKLLVWPYRDVKTSACRELTLPQTDLAHKAALVCVFYDEDSQMPSCVGVSPEGVVRYWPSVAHEGTYVDETADLQGQECDSLTDAGSMGCVLATTTCTVVVVHTAHTDGRASISLRPLRAPGGWLGGLGRRVSLLIFGSMPAQTQETKLAGVCVFDSLTLQNEEGVSTTSGPYVVCVAAGPALQLWTEDRLVRELDLRKPLRELFYRHQLTAVAGDVNTLEVYVLDIQPSNNNLLMLTAAANPTRSLEMRYALVTISLEESPWSRVTGLTPLPRPPPPASPAPREPEPLRLLECGARVCLYTHRQLAVCGTMPNDKPDYVDLASEGDRILGAALCHGLPLFFTKNNGIVAVVPNDRSDNDGSICESPLGSPCPSDMYDGHLSLYEIDPDEISQVTTDAQGRLKTAFLYHVRRDAAACRAILDELFPAPRATPAPPARAPLSLGNMSEEEDEQDVDSALDRTVMKIAREMLDDVPAGDPRWNASTTGDAVNIPLGSSSALRILTQLRDKQKALNLFIDFLRATGLWGRLGYISRDLGCVPGNGIVSTHSALCQLLERVAAAAALRRMQQGAFANIIDTAIHQVIHADTSSEAENSALLNRTLSPSDLFYKRVTSVERCAIAVVRCCEEQMSDSLPRLLLSANRLLVSFLQEVHKSRAANAAALPTPPPRRRAAAATWTGALGGEAFLAALGRQQRRTVLQGARATTDATLRGQLYDQAVSLAEAMLTDAAYLTQSPDTQPAYEALRRDLLQPLMEDEQYERASILAEKFKDFETLISICTKIEDMDKLYEYMDKYASEGFIEQTFAYLSESGSSNASRLLRCLGERYSSRLRAWLAAPERHKLLWLQEIHAGAWGNAAAVTAELAAGETDSVERMLTMASLSKLLSLVADTPEVCSRAERCLSLAEQHRALPRELLVRHGLDAGEKMKVFTPEDLILMYTSDNVGLTEYDFKKALDLADMIDDPLEREVMRLKIWCAAILQDEWSEYDPDSPLDAVQEKVFFKLVDLAELLGCNVDTMLPPASRLIEAEPLRPLATDTGFQFLLRYGYEHLRRGADVSTD